MDNYHYKYCGGIFFRFHIPNNLILRNTNGFAKCKHPAAL